jgi:hypothetical protein
MKPKGHYRWQSKSGAGCPPGYVTYAMNDDLTYKTYDILSLNQKWFHPSSEEGRRIRSLCNAYKQILYARN